MFAPNDHWEKLWRTWKTTTQPRSLPPPPRLPPSPSRMPMIHRRNQRPSLARRRRRPLRRQRRRRDRRELRLRWRLPSTSIVPPRRDPRIRRATPTPQVRGRRNPRRRSARGRNKLSGVATIAGPAQPVSSHIYIVECFYNVLIFAKWFYM